MSETTVLYALSTLAQTCAALAAFVGAVGLFRLQILRDQRKEVEQTFRLYAYINTRTPDGDWGGTPYGFGPRPGPVEAVIEYIDRLPPDHPARGAVVAWQQDARPIRHSRNLLIAFEVWNVGVAGLALIGFNYVDALTGSRSTLWALWAAAVGTFLVTVYCVYGWTRGVE